MTNNRPHNFEEVLARCPGAKQSGDEYTAPCLLPGHKTPAGHLTLKDAGDKALVTCQGGKHTYQDICQSVGFESLTYSNNGSGLSSIGNARYSDTRQPKHKNSASKNDSKSVSPLDDHPDTGVTLQTISEVKHLPVDFLKSLGMSDFKYCGQPAVKIPYYSEDGGEMAIRYRVAMSGDRFKWRKGDHAAPYGLNRLPQIRQAGWVLIVEGESDCWTLWLNGLPALGAPGKGIWPVAWGEYLKGLQVYVWQEPDAEDFTLRVLKSAPELKYIRAPAGIKDISEAHIQGRDVPPLLEELKVNAESGQALKAKYDNEQLGQLYTEAKTIIEAEDPLIQIENSIRGLGFGGDIRPAKIVYLAATSRLLEMRDGAMPVHLLLLGSSSSGKSYTLHVALSLFPADAQHTISAGSPRTIIYDDSDLQHRVLIFGEADSLPAGEDNPAASAIRNLLQDHSLHYDVTIRDAVTGDFVVRTVDKPGPTVLITTSTRPLGTQLMTRLFTLEISDSKAQIGAALNTQATLETEGSKPVDSSLVAFQAYLQLKAPFKVVVPFAGKLAGVMSKMASAPRILRDFARLLSLIKSITVIRHHRRQTDNTGRLVATLADYETVRELVNDMYIDSTGANSEVRKLVEAVKALDVNRTDGERITVSKLADHLGINRLAASRRSKRALKEDWLINRESRKGYPADFAIGEPIPDTEGLPDLITVSPCKNEVIQKSSFNNEACITVSPLTDSSRHTTTLPDELTAGSLPGDLLEVWVAKGRPVIYLGAGESTQDLEKVLKFKLNEHQTEALNKWYQKNIVEVF